MPSINRISGLDPSSSGFNEPTSNSNFLLPLSSLDAEFTDVIHTDAGFQGAESDSATADFWPNFGHRRQPGCGASNVYDKETSKNGTFCIKPNWQSNNRIEFYLFEWFSDLCSHKRAYQYWAESVVSDNKDTFLAVAAKNFTYFRNGELNLSQIASMGLNCSLKYIHWLRRTTRIKRLIVNSIYFISVLWREITICKPMNSHRIREELLD